MLAGLGSCWSPSRSRRRRHRHGLGCPVATALGHRRGAPQIGEFSRSSQANWPSSTACFPAAPARRVRVITITISPRALPARSGRSDGSATATRASGEVLQRARAELQPRRANAYAVRAIAESDGPLAIVVGHGPVGQPSRPLAPREARRDHGDHRPPTWTSSQASPPPERAAIFGDNSSASGAWQAGVTRVRDRDDAALFGRSTRHDPERAGPG